MARSQESFNRPNPRFQPQPTVLIICEDTKSGKRYLEDACNQFRVGAQVEIIHCGKTDPKNIVLEAKRRKAKFDNVFCAIDRDTHTTFDEAVQLALASPKVTLVVSHPCFEFWLLLHFRYTRKPYMRSGSDSPADVLIRDLCTYPNMTDYAKGNSASVFDLLFDLLPTARKNAHQAFSEAVSCDELNPSTEVHKLLDFLENLGKPQPVTGA